MNRSILISVLIVIISVLSGAAYGAEVVSVAAVRDSAISHRLVIEFTGRVKFGIVRSGREVSIQMREVDGARPVEWTAATELFNVVGAATVSDSKGRLTTVKVGLADGVEASEHVLTNPFRIVLKAEAARAPSSSVKAADRKAGVPEAKGNVKAAGRAADEAKGISVKAAAPVAPVAGDDDEEAMLKAAARLNARGDLIEPLKKKAAGGEAGAYVNEIRSKPLLGEFAPHEGWRWLYRRRAIDLLQREVIGKDRLAEGLIAGLAGAPFKDMDEMAAGLPGRAAEMKGAGEESKARVLEGIGALLTGAASTTDFEAVLRGAGGREEAAIGRFVLADRLERQGLAAEALGNYGRVINNGGAEAAASAALFRKARLLFYDGKYEEAKRWFSKAAADKVDGAEVWLANALFMKGETAEALSIFTQKGVEVSDGFDSVTIMSLGDMNLELKNYGAARNAYSWLMLRHKEDELLMAYFRLRTADAFAAEGLKDDAIKIYLRNKEGVKGAGRECASLAYADAIASRGDAASNSRARQFYALISAESGSGAESALLSLAAMDARLGNFPEALAGADRFVSRYTTSPFRGDAMALKGKAAAALISRHHDSGEHLEAATAYYRFGPQIPFGRRAEATLKAGKSMLALSLFDDAARLLGDAAKMGRDTKAAEDAYIALAAAHLGRNDPAAAAGAVAELKRIFPGTARLSEVNALAVKAAYLKGDYKTAASYPADGLGAEAAYMRALSLYRLADFKGAAAAFEALSPSGPAEIGLGDSLYKLGSLEKALAAYGRAAADRSLTQEDRTWALYRTAAIAARLGRGEEGARALKAMKEMKGDLPPWSGVLFKEPAASKGAAL